ncbi:MAG: carboxypeptidase regulatory-like domain-containing protein [Candidatus Acidiferrum sp.]
MRKRLTWLGSVLAVLLVCVLVLTMLPPAFAQETTGGVKGYIKDKSGASVPKAEVELTSSALLVPKKAEADNAGYFYFSLLPPGSYTVTVTAPGFRTFKQTEIPLTVGALPTIDINMEIGSLSEVIEVTGRAPIVDVTTSKVAVAITETDIDNLPKGRSYQTVIALAPGARQEPLQSSRTDRNRQNGFQIDGSSDSENTYLVEGMDTSNVEQGGIKQGVIFEFVQEVQVKTAGTEAEYGGAMGGVVNVIQKRGSNEWHGGFLAHFRNEKLDANDQCTTTPQPSSAQTPAGQQINCGQRYDPSTSSNGNPLNGPVHDQATNYYIQKKDPSSTVEAGYQIGGPIWKDKLWMFSSYIPTIDRLTRTINFTTVGNVGPRAFTRSYTAHNMLNRLDYQPFSKLHLFSGWQYGYSRIKGQLPTYPDSAAGQANPIGGSDPSQFRSDRGSVNPSNIFNFGGDWTPNSRTVISVKYGYFYYNMEDRGLPSGIRYVYQNDLTGGVTKSPVDSSILVPAGSNFAQPTGFANMASNLSTKNDIFSRKTLATDASYSVSKWGQHNFKVGYGFNRLYNNIFQNFNTAVVNLFWGQVYTPVSSQGTTNCAAIIAVNGVCAGTAGYFTISDGVETNGIASSYNHGIYGQDSWSVGHGLTLNFGIRFDKEFLPPYSPGNPSINFGFTQKVGPRIGGAYDLLHNGKVKIYASYGKFFDIMKYSLPRGSFGGDYWHDCIYAMNVVNYNTITPSSPGGHSCGPDSGPSAGVTVGTFIENYNWRAPAGSTTDPGVDPNLKPMSQHEYLMGADWAISSKMGLAVRYSRKRLDNAIDDQSIDDGVYYIGNPGPNTYSNLLHRALPAAGFVTPICPTCPNAPQATRKYDGLESRFTYRSSKLVALVSYTYSKLNGNYSGLTDTDITDGNGGRHNANNNRSFDLPEMQYTTTGKVVDGPLATDRPNVLNMSGYYPIKWLGMLTTVGLIQTVAQGSPKSTCVPVVDSASSCQFYDQRGTWANFAQDPTTGVFNLTSVEHGARMPLYTQTDLSLAHGFKVSKTNEAMRLTFEFDAYNLLNQHAVLSVSPDPFHGTNQYLKFADPTNPAGANVSKFLTGYDVAAEATAQGNMILSSHYGLPILLQSARTMRLGVRFNF